MAKEKTVVYECEVCGTEVTVNGPFLPDLSPVYCCGISLSEQKAPAKKKAVKAATKKTAGKKTAAKPVKKTAKKPVGRTSSKKKK